MQSGEYQYLVIKGEYQSWIDYDIYMSEYMDFTKHCEDRYKYPEEKYTTINIYCRPSLDNYLIENYNNSSRYDKKSSYTKVLNFHELMDYIYLKV